MGENAGIVNTEPLFELSSTRVSNAPVIRNFTINIKNNSGEEFKMNMEEMSKLITAIVTNYLNTYGESWKGL